MPSARLLILFSAVAALACFAVPNSTAGASKEKEVASLSGASVSVGNPVLASVDFGEQFASIDELCFEFTFHGDLFDPGEVLLITPLNLFQPPAGFGFDNLSDRSQNHRALCFRTEDQPFLVALFLDGAEDQMQIHMRTGSVTIDRLRIVLYGTS